MKLLSSAQKKKKKPLIHLKDRLQWEEIFASHTSDGGLISILLKKSLKGNKKSNSPIINWVMK